MAGEKLFVRKTTKIPALPLPPTVTRPETLAVEVFFSVFVCEYESEGGTAQQENATKTIMFLVRNLIGLNFPFVTCAQASIIRLDGTKVCKQNNAVVTLQIILLESVAELITSDRVIIGSDIP